MHLLSSYKKSYVTFSLLFINVIVYAYMLIRFGSSTSYDALIATGAKSNFHIVAYHQWYRLITPSFIHIGFEHLFFNCLTLYFIGQDLEALMGHWRFACLFFVASFGGNLFSFALNMNVSAGASTGIFGLFVAYVILAKMYPHSFALQQRAINFALLIVLNIVTGFMSTGIDNWGHFGGAVFGALITLILGLGSGYRSTIDKRDRFLALIAVILLSVGMLFWGIQRTKGAILGGF